MATCISTRQNQWVKELIYPSEMSCVLTEKPFRIRNPVTTGIALAAIQQGLIVKVCTEWFCQVREILFAAILDVLCPHGGFFVWSRITSRLYHHVSKSHWRLFLDLQPFRGHCTCTDYMKCHTWTVMRKRYSLSIIHCSVNYSVNVLWIWT